MAVFDISLIGGVVVVANSMAGDCWFRVNVDTCTGLVLVKALVCRDDSDKTEANKSGDLRVAMSFMDDDYTLPEVVVLDVGKNKNC